MPHSILFEDPVISIGLALQTGPILSLRGNVSEAFEICQLVKLVVTGFYGNVMMSCVGLGYVYERGHLLGLG